MQRFERLRPEVSALDALATRQGVDRVQSLEDAAPLLFDHRVYKSYPTQPDREAPVRSADDVACGG